jgi:hypothetical protein
MRRTAIQVGDRTFAARQFLGDRCHLLFSDVPVVTIECLSGNLAVIGGEKDSNSLRDIPNGEASETSSQSRY